MKRAFRVALGLVAILAIRGQEARAQGWYYPAGYGNYGWGGWGGVTPGGDIARGMGVYAMGAGVYNVDTARANAINAETLGRWNEYLWESQQVRNRQEYDIMAARRALNIKSRQELYAQLKDHPSQTDVEDGDALNLVLDQLSLPAIHKTVLATAKGRLDKDAIRAIPYQYASEGVTIALHGLTEEDGWPLQLRGEALAPERAAYQKAIDAALKQDTEGDLTPETIANVRKAVDRLRAKADATIPRNTPEALQADNFIKAMAGMARMLQRPEIDTILGRLDQAPGTTLADLLGFMTAFNLRFAPATTDEQRQIYRDLYPMLVNLRGEIFKRPVANAPGNVDPLSPRPESLKGGAGRAGSFFQKMDWDALNAQPRPANAPVPPPAAP